MNSLSPQALAAARAESRVGGGTVLDALLRHWPGDPADLLDRLEAHTGIAPVEARLPHQPTFEHWSPEDVRTHRCVALAQSDGTVVVAAADPWATDLHRLVERRLGADVPLRAATGAQLEAWSQNSPAGTGAVSLKIDPQEVAGPIVSFVDAALHRAMAIGASDVHFECDRAGVSVKHRIDGVMQRFARMEGVASAEAVVSRIKVMSQLDITERRLPQDGRFRHLATDPPLDIRVSIMPSVHGEDAVLRLLDKSQFRASTPDTSPGIQPGLSLDALGFEPARREAIRELALEPSGMLLVTGPTGSGKTTTLYAVLSEINTGLEKIVTIEDPVEYELDGVLQIPVNERKGLTFAKGLRSILRHDPDRILVGEIRDAETAEIAVQASLTGHQVFTTVHANSMGDVMGRFLHFGLDMFGFTSALNGVVVQRLLRRLCAFCKEKRQADSLENACFLRHQLETPPSLWRAVGCERCSGTGYAGRFVIAEIHKVDDALRDLVTARAPLSAIKQHALNTGVESLRTIGLRQAAAGGTTMEELKRVVGSL